MLRSVLLYAMCVVVGLCTACKDDDDEDYLEPIDETPIVVPADFVANTGSGGISVLGNSISTYYGFVPHEYANFYVSQIAVAETWWEMLAWLMHSHVNSNASWSGSKVANIGKDSPDSFFSSDKRINALAQQGEPEFIFIAGGTNDWYASVCQLGDVKAQQIDSTTFAGAYSLMLTKIKNKYPRSTVVCLSIFPRSSSYSKRNGKGLSMNDLNKAISSLAGKYGCTYIDVTRCGMSADIDRYTLDGVHPSALGMTLIARSIYRHLCEKGLAGTPQ